MADDEEMAAIEARILAAGFAVHCDDRPPPGVADRWLAAAIPTLAAATGATDRAATGITRLAALRELEVRLFG